METVSLEEITDCSWLCELAKCQDLELCLTPNSVF